MKTDLTTILTVCGAIIVAGIAAYSSLIQIRANHIAASQIQWLKDLRSHLSFLLVDSISIKNLGLSQQFDEPLVRDKLSNLIQNALEIEMRLNELNPQQAALLRRVRTFKNQFSQCSPRDATELSARLENERFLIAQISSLVFSIEWEKIKLRPWQFRRKRRIFRLKSKVKEIS